MKPILSAKLEYLYLLTVLIFLRSLLGKREAEINVAEGMKRARILNSEAFKSEQVNQATGEAQAVIWKAKAQATSLNVISQAMAQKVI